MDEDHMRLGWISRCFGVNLETVLGANCFSNAVACFQWHVLAVSKEIVCLGSV